jgi:threonine aldolase
VIDLRSDTVTMPGPEMRAAMAAALVGDDFYREDPTVRELERRAAEATGKEAALFLPSGTMGNLVAALTHAPGGGEVVGPETAHAFRNEAGGLARIAGITVRGVSQAAGELSSSAFEAAIHGVTLLAQPTRLLWVEQPTRGFVVPLSDLEAICVMADEAGLPIHLDGARIFNAATALDVSVSTIATLADSVMFCLSKGLGAPVGSLLAGNGDFIERARASRQVLGGGMRQAGVLAAAGLYALDHNVHRLSDDHANASLLARELTRMAIGRPDREVVETNMFYLDPTGWDATPSVVTSRLAETGILVNAPSRNGLVRFVTHLGVARSDVMVAAEAIAQAIR